MTLAQARGSQPNQGEGALRLGVFGGAFDPPHIAHVALARAALEQLALDRLHIVPTGLAWHKTQSLSAPAHRLAMAQLAFAELARVQVDARELHRPGPSYTVDTLRELAAEHPGAQLFLVLGQDQAQSLTRWHQWQTILGLAVICMAQRPADPAMAVASGATSSAASSAASTGGAPGAPAPGTTIDPARLGLPAPARLRLLQLPSMAVSATEIRQRVARQEGIDHLVAPAVARYIDTHHLYQPA